MILQVRNALEGQLEGKLELMLAVQSPTWSSEGYVGVQIGSDCAASADCTGLSGAQEASKRPGKAFKRPGKAFKRPRSVATIRLSSASPDGSEASGCFIRIDTYRYLYFYKLILI